MGKALDIEFMTARDTGFGSSRYGACEICGAISPLIHVAELQRVYIRDNGQHYLSPASAGVYGHLVCLIERFGTLRCDEDFARVAGTKMVSPEQLEMLKAAQGEKT